MPREGYTFTAANSLGEFSGLKHRTNSFSLALASLSMQRKIRMRGNQGNQERQGQISGEKRNLKK
jgi:hypothetical protein